MYYADTISPEAVTNQQERVALAERCAEEDGQGVRIIAVAPDLWDLGSSYVLAWWPRSGGEYVTWALGESGFYSGRYLRCSELEAWEAFYKRIGN